MRVPLSAPGRLDRAEAEAVQAAAKRVVESDQWILGPSVRAFETEFAEYLGHHGREVVGVGNGTDALVLAFGALELPAGSVVLVAADEGGYAACAATQAGLRVRVMDVDATRGVPTVATAQAAYDEEVAALVVTHLHGDAVPLRDLDRWRREQGIALIEDCAQAHGLRADQTHVGGIGDAATFSFYPTKNLGAIGDAGAVSLNVELAGRARELRQYGWGRRYRIERGGGRNTRLDELQAAILRVRLPQLDAANERRRTIAARYRDLLPLHGDPATTVAHHAVALFPDRAARDQAAAGLEAAGVDTDVHYPFLVQEMPGLSLAEGCTPNASQRRGRQLTLPCFPTMTEVEIDHVVASLEQTLAQNEGKARAHR